MARLFRLVPVLAGLVALCCFSLPAAAAQLIEVAPVGPRTLRLTFDEGEKRNYDYPDFWVFDAPDEAYYGPLDTDAARLPANYRLSSAADSSYATAALPVRVGLKAKRQVAYYEYQVYLEWPVDLVPGAIYTISTVSIGSNATDHAYTYAPVEQYSPAVHVNQVGMLAQAARKYAYLSQWIGTVSDGPAYVDYSALEGAAAEVRRASDDAVMYSGSGAQGIRFRLPDQVPTFAGFLAAETWFGTPTWEFDFSPLGTDIAADPAEEYYVYVSGVGRSHPFRIADDAYDAAFKLIARGVYHQRSGPERGAPYSDFPKPIDHTPGTQGFALTYSQYSRMQHEADPQGDDGLAFQQLPAQATDWVYPTNPAPWMSNQPDWGYGGHFDAADYDIYPQHLNLPIQWSLAYLLAPDGFTDGQLNIPESGNGLPDLLDEARWTLDFFRRTKGPTGGVCGGRETTDYFHPSWNDGSGASSSERTWYVYREDPATSFLYAGAAALFHAALLRAGDPSGAAAGYLADAQAAYAWATSNVTDAELALSFSGMPIQGYVRDLRLFAAAALYSETGQADYLQTYLDRTAVQDGSDDLYLFEGYDHSFATWVFSLIPTDKWTSFGATAQALQATQRTAIINWSSTWGTQMLSDERPMRHIAARFAPPLGGTSSSTPRLWPQIMAYHHTQDAELLAQMLASNDFYLGGNPENKVYITGADRMGAESYPRDPLHIDSYEDGVDAFIPGIVLYAITPPSFYDFEMIPDQAFWPHLELNSDTRVFIQQAEFTHHQNNVPAAAAYGYLNSVLNPDAAVSTRPGPAVSSPAPTLRISPNPLATEGWFELPAPLVSNVARLRDTSGKQVGEVALRRSAATVHFTLPALPAGIYFLDIQTQSGPATGKVVRR